MGKGNSKGGVEEGIEGMERTPRLVKFPVGLLCGLRERLLEDLSREQFAVLLGKWEHCGDTALCCVREMRLFDASDLSVQSVASLKIRKEGMLSLQRLRRLLCKRAGSGTAPTSIRAVGSLLTGVTLKIGGRGTTFSIT